MQGAGDWAMFRAMNLQRTSAVLLGAAIAATGCHKSKQQPAPTGATMGSASGSATAAGDMKPEPVEAGGGSNGAGQASGAAEAKPTEPSSNPAPAGDEVRAPTAADLETYTKNLKGKGPLTATIDTSQGTIHCELFADKAPMTVANFVGLATGQKPWMDPSSHQVVKGKPFYDGLTFHRVIPQFMIQGGDPMGTGQGGPGYEFANESTGLEWKPGTLAMANAGPDTNGSQFFITEIAPSWLDGHYSMFGQCKEVDVVKKITALHGPGDHPTTPVTINHITISRG